MDPTNHLHLVATFHANCTGAYAPMCMAETNDGGTTWRLFKGPANAWVENSRPIVIGPKSWLYVTYSNGLFYTGDSGATWQQVGPGGYHQMYHAKDGSYYLGSAYGVQKSTDGGKTWNKIPNSPLGDGLVGDGTRMLNSVRDPDAMQPYFSASEGGGSTWTPFSSPNMKSGAVYLVYDPDHQLIYSANTQSGLWRMVSKGGSGVKTPPPDSGTGDASTSGH
jgi:hypothetical protein